MNTYKIPLLLIVIAIIFFGAGIYIQKEDKDLSETTVPLPTLPQATSTPPIVTIPPVTDSGIQGTVTIGPSCPVITDPPQGQCADKPYATTFRLLRSDGTFVKNFSSDKNGNFKVTVTPGNYKIEEANPKTLPRMGTVDSVVVTANKFTNLHIDFDSGIR